MERRSFKAINFDLDTVRMKELGVYPYGYSEIRDFFHHNGFSHRQGSGYVSTQKMNSMDIARLTKLMVNSIDWLAICVKKIDVTDIGKQHDLTKIVLEYSKKQKIDATMLAKPMLNEEEAKIVDTIKLSPLKEKFQELYNGEPNNLSAGVEFMQLLSKFVKDNKSMINIYKTSRLYSGIQDNEYINDLINIAVPKNNLSAPKKTIKANNDNQSQR